MPARLFPAVLAAAASILAACGGAAPAASPIETVTETVTATVTVTPTTTPRRLAVVPTPAAVTTTRRPKPRRTSAPAPPVGVYYANCSEAEDDGAAPLHRGEPGYRSGLDRDHDGVACE